MVIGMCKIKLSAPWVNSLKEKRRVVKSIVERTKNKFNVSVAEVAEQDTYRTIIIGFACVTNTVAHANSMVDNVLNFIEESTDAIVEKTEIEIL